MSLNYDLSKVKGKDTLCYYTADRTDRERGITQGEQYLSPVTHSIIFSLGVLGAGSITEKNIARLRVRAAVYARLFGWSFNPESDDFAGYTLDDLTAHVGLTTNWRFKDETDAGWGKRMIANALSEESRRALRAAA